MGDFDRFRVPDTALPGVGGDIVYPTLPDPADFISVTPWHDPTTGRRGTNPKVTVAVWHRTRSLLFGLNSVARAKQYPSVCVELTEGAAAVQNAVHQQAAQYVSLNSAWALDESISGRATIHR